MAKACEHLGVASTREAAVAPGTPGCAECLTSRGRWMHLRLCLTCGHVGCCDSSPGRHATGHFHASGHPVIKAFEPGEDWAWCYVDEATVPAVPAFQGETPARHLAPR